MILSGDMVTRDLMVMNTIIYVLMLAYIITRDGFISFCCYIFLMTRGLSGELRTWDCSKRSPIKTIAEKAC